MQAVALIETTNGENWISPGVSSNNMGAIQAGSGWTGAWFAYGDTHPQPDGTSKPYAAKFRRYDTPAAGFADLVRVLYLDHARDKRVLPFASRGDWLGFSTGLHQAPCYYEGHGASDDERIANHCAAVIGAVERIAFDLGEPGPDIGLPPSGVVGSAELRKAGLTAAELPF